VGQDGVTVLLSLLLLIVTATVPFWSQDIQPFCVVTQKCSQQNKEKEICILVAQATDNGTSFLSPHSPSALTG
jgi:hypothetical protein